MSGYPYQYVVLRLVPRIERQEFVNVGVVVYSQEAEFIDGGFHLDDERIRALDPQADLEAVRAALETVCHVARGEGGPPGRLTPGRRFGWLAAPRSTIVQPGPVHGGLSDDPARTLEHLLQRLVLVAD
ncbi:MAG: DUF3037 domain-containing protein [Dermatophilaceae bacterium]|nr:DUF3037 domain-containing protein [Intrasporangiaceae bacterium]